MSDNMNESIDDQAARWAARSLSGDFSDAERRALEKWREADQRHRDAFDEYMTIADCSAYALKEADSEQKIHQFPTPSNRRGISAGRRGIWFVAMPAIAASIAAAFVFAFIIDRPIAVENYATAKGEVSEITLADASVVVLNTNTEIAVRYTKESRTVALVRGEALFEVVRDPDRPFIVQNAGREARVLGTKFNVRTRSGEMTVSVLSGLVEVGSASRDDSQSDPVVLSAGREATFFNQELKASVVREFNPAIVGSWRQGVARYENEELSDVVADLNRYFAVQIELGDDTLADIPVTGGFNLKNQDVAVEALSVALNLRAEQRGRSEIVLLPYE